ncbi:MAG: PIN domain-containing protein [Bryobacteraceae bacterium]|nr:PIN domain-containing protein [Bryobacteraceae bacterium]
MAASALVDTGAIIAFLDPSDRWHRACVEAIAQIPLPLLTSEAVLTELFHLRGPRGYDRTWRFVRSAVSLASMADEELPAIHSLMTQYADRPMDFADATLVYLANREGLSTILTIDHDDFETYRLAGRKRFRILPTRRL